MSQESIVATILQMKAFQDTQEQCRMGNMEGNKIFRHVQEVCESHSEIQELLMDVTENARSAIYGEITSQLRSLLPKEENENQGLDVSSLPTPLYNIIQLYHSETNAFRRVHRLIDLFEWAIKWHTVVVVSDLLREADISDELKVLFSSGLRVPSLGVWMHFFRAALEAIQRPSFPYAQWECLLEIEKKYQIVHFRNGYAHGATPSDEDCQKDCERLFPVLQKLISSPMFSALQVVYFDGNQNYRWVGAEKIPSETDIPERRVVIVHKDHPSEKRIDLWPLAMNSIDPQHPQKGHQFFYFNALKNKSIEQLNYEYGLHFRDKKLWDVFHDSLPIDEWKRVTDPKLDLFRERIEALTEVFKGRQQEKERLRAFCLAGKGNQMVWGGPGIGKSALLAQVFKEIRGGVDADGVSLEGEYPHILPYFIRRGTETSMPERFLRHLCLQLDVMYELKGFGLGNSTGELSESLNLRLQQLSEQEETKRLVLFVDGLDEALGGNTTILRFIPTPKKWLTVLCASRQVPEVEEWYNRREHRDAFGVTPLSIFDIRALLYEVVDKYDEGLSQEYVTAIAAVSQGNPLYLKLLCDQLSAGIQQVGAIEELPREMEDLYKEVLFRVTDRGRNENAHRLLLLLTEAKASLSAEVISDVLDISMTAANAALDDCMELLFEDPLTPDLLDYQLFHESLREYVRKTEKKSTEKMAVRLTDFCFGWRNLESHSLRYALEFASAHIRDRNDTERLWSLLYDEEYRKTQIKVSYQFEYSYAALLDGLECYVDQNGETEEAEARLAWLMLKGGELAREAIEGVDIAFVWFQEDPQKLDMALKRIDVLDEKGFFKACLKLLMIEAWRQCVLEK